MPLMSIIRFVFSLLSLLVLGCTVYLVWTWYQGELVLQANGNLVRIRHDWHLWLGLGLLAWSILGRVVAVPLFTKRDSDPSRAQREGGVVVAGASGSSLYVEMTGPADAPAIVLTHGWAMDSTIWYYAKRHLSREFRVIAWDLPGMGESKAAIGKSIGLSEFAQDLMTVIGLAGDHPVILVGHSIGGMTIQTLARDNAAFFNERIAGAVLINTTYTNPLKTMIMSRLAQAIRWPVLEPVMRLTIILQPLVWLSAWQSYFSGSAHLANRIGFGKYVTRSQLEHTTLLSTRNAPGNIARGNLAMFRWDATGALSRVRPRILVIGGAKDIVTKPEASRTIARTKPNAQLQIIEGVNHMGFLERSDQYNESITSFAQSLPLAPRPR